MNEKVKALMRRIAFQLRAALEGDDFALEELQEVLAASGRARRRAGGRVRGDPRAHATRTARTCPTARPGRRAATACSRSRSAAA